MNAVKSIDAVIRRDLLVSLRFRLRRSSNEQQSGPPTRNMRPAIDEHPECGFCLACCLFNSHSLTIYPYT